MKFVKILLGVFFVAMSSVAAAGWFGPSDDDINKMPEDELYAWESGRAYEPGESWRIAEGARYSQIYAYLSMKEGQNDKTTSI
jgi:hypothetical protein